MDSSYHLRRITAYKRHIRRPREAHTLSSDIPFVNIISQKPNKSRCRYALYGGIGADFWDRVAIYAKYAIIKITK